MSAWSTISCFFIAAICATACTMSAWAADDSLVNLTPEEVIIENQLTIAENQDKRFDTIESKVDMLGDTISSIVSDDGLLAEAQRGIYEDVENTEGMENTMDLETQENSGLPSEDYETDSPAGSDKFLMDESQFSRLEEDLSYISGGIHAIDDNIHDVNSRLDKLMLIMCIFSGMLIGALVIGRAFK